MIRKAKAVWRGTGRKRPPLHRFRCRRPAVSPWHLSWSETNKLHRWGQANPDFHPVVTTMHHGPLRVGVGGPVGSGKTALVEALCKRLRDEARRRE
jgi:hypothetical protein